MLISNRREFVFIHIYKTAGMSLNTILAPYARFVDRLAYGWRPTQILVGRINRILGLQDDGNRWLTGIHMHATAAEAREYLGHEAFNRYFKFAIVREPLDWLASLFSYIRQSPKHRHYSRVQRLSFDEFVLAEIARSAPAQSDFVVDQEGRVLVDYIGHFETLSVSVGEIGRRLKLPRAGHVPHANQSRSRQGKGRQIVVQPETLAAINKYFARDFELFGYALHDTTASTVINL